MEKGKLLAGHVPKIRPLNETLGTRLIQREDKLGWLYMNRLPPPNQASNRGLLMTDSSLRK